MSITVATTAGSEGRQCVIKISGCFDYSLSREFLSAFETSPGCDTYVVDLSHTTRIGGGALGLLLLLRDHAGGDGSRVMLCHYCSEVEKVLETHNLRQLFTLLPARGQASGGGLDRVGFA